MASPTQRSFLGDRVVVELRRMIAGGELPPGARILERDIAQRLGTSRGPVRDAIRTLEHEGLVEIRPYAGARVAIVDRDEIDEILALRRQVEYFAVAGATLRATAEEIAGLRDLAEQMAPAFADDRFHEVLELDLAFHIAICEASHHTTLAVTMRMLYPRLAILMYPQMSDGTANHTADSFTRAHVELVEAIEGGDVEQSLAAVDRHLDEFFTDVELLIDGAPRRRRPAYLTRHEPARPVAVRRRLGGARG